MIALIRHRDRYDVRLIRIIQRPGSVHTRHNDNTVGGFTQKLCSIVQYRTLGTVPTQIHHAHAVGCRPADSRIHLRDIRRKIGVSIIYRNQRKVTHPGNTDPIVHPRANQTGAHRGVIIIARKDRHLIHHIPAID